MENKIEIQIITPATKEQLLELRDEIRKIKGMEAFELDIPRRVPQEGAMGEGVLFEIALAVITGIGHFASEKTYEYFPEFCEAVSKVFRPKGDSDNDLSMGNSKNWEVVISSESNGVKNNLYLDSEGTQQNYSGAGYSIRPERTFALLIGGSQYDDEASFAPIGPANKNLNDMFNVFNDKRLMGLPLKNIELLYNESSVNIKIAISNASKKDEIDTLLIYFTGHGQSMRNQQLSLIAKDTRNIDDELHYDIPYSFVEQKLKYSHAQQKIILIDACHSGLATQGNNDINFENVSGTFTLASTSADESAYFKKDADNTYFTGFLVEAFKNGISNTSSMLSLNDLYLYTKQKLTESNLPAPTCKSQLENVIPEKFYISKNPAFMLDARLKRPSELYEAGQFEEAKKDYLFLLKEYPDKTDLTAEYLGFEKNILFNSLVSEADKLFYESRNYSAALNKYREALTIKADDVVKTRIIECKNKELSVGEVREEKASQKTAVNQSLGRHKPAEETQKKKVNMKAAALVIILFGGSIAILSTKYFNEKGNAQETTHTEQTKDQPAVTDSIKPSRDSEPGKDTASKPGVVIKNDEHTPAKPNDRTQNIVPVEEDQPNTGDKKTTADLSGINGSVYWEKSSSDNIKFTISSGNLVSFAGRIGGYSVSGMLKLSANMAGKVIAGDVTGNLNFFDNNNQVAGKLSVKENGFSKAITLEKKMF